MRSRRLVPPSSASQALPALRASSGPVQPGALKSPLWWGTGVAPGSSWGAAPPGEAGSSSTAASSAWWWNASSVSAQER